MRLVIECRYSADSIHQIGRRNLESSVKFCLIVYRMGRLCGGAHEISNIKAPIFLRGWVGAGGVSGGVGKVRWVVVGWGWWGGCWWGRGGGEGGGW